MWIHIWLQCSCLQSETENYKKKKGHFNYEVVSIWTRSKKDEKLQIFWVWTFFEFAIGCVAAPCLCRKTSSEILRHASPILFLLWKSFQDPFYIRLMILQEILLAWNLAENLSPWIAIGYQFVLRRTLRHNVRFFLSLTKKIPIFAPISEQHVNWQKNYSLKNLPHGKNWQRKQNSRTTC